jgi:hypothetical protein
VATPIKKVASSWSCLLPFLFLPRTRSQAQPPPAMPITRRERRELDRGLRRLRSGKSLRPQPATPPSRGSGHRRKQSSSLVFANSDLIVTEAALKESQRHEDGQGSHDISALSSTSVKIRTQPLAIRVVKYVVRRLLFSVFY